MQKEASESTPTKHFWNKPRPHLIPIFVLRFAHDSLDARLTFKHGDRAGHSVTLHDVVPNRLNGVSTAINTWEDGDMIVAEDMPWSEPNSIADYTKLIELAAPWFADDAVYSCGLKQVDVQGVLAELEAGISSRDIIEDGSIETWDFTILVHLLLFNTVWGGWFVSRNRQWCINKLRDIRNTSVCHAYF